MENATKIFAVLNGDSRVVATFRHVDVALAYFEREEAAYSVVRTKTERKIGQAVWAFEELITKVSA